MGREIALENKLPFFVFSLLSLCVLRVRRLVGAAKVRGLRDAAVATRARFYPAVRSLKATDKDQLRAHLDVAEAGDAEIL